ncbi:MAG TPA: YihY/virulence factor BrkB family protein [Solirubrobacterales bacterium]|jgi:membrane protein|nr:YihY/virulence factor BrkB family protein [Solirubrobacterales bacterium]
MAAEREPIALRDLGREGWKRVAKCTFERFGKVQLTDRAAALAYYGFLSLFPALIVAIAALALIGSYPETYRAIIDALRDAAPGTAVDTIDSALRDVLRGRGAGSLLGIGLVFSLITASNAVGAAIRALEVINGTTEAASFVRSNLTRLWLTVALMAGFLVAFAALVLAGPIFGAIAEDAGLGEAGRTIISVGRYPIGLAALLGATLLLYTRGPAGTRRRVVDHLPGALLAAALWVLASMGFSFYVSNFGSYDATYGSLGAVIVLLIWIYISSIALLLGALVNHELLRARGLL